jgi:signal transduction histidine kinase
MPSNTRTVRRAALGVTGQVLGGVVIVLEVVFLAVGVLAQAIPALRASVGASSRKLVEFHRWRLVAYLKYDDHLYVMPDWRRAHAYMLRRIVVGAVGAATLGLILVGLASALIMAWQVVSNRPIGGESGSGDLSREGNTVGEIVAIAAVGLVLFFVAVWGLIGVAMLERTLADRYLVPTENELLRRRVMELADTRAAVVTAVNDERRRIERDLHDGVQQRMVALGMLLGRALRAKDPRHAEKLLLQAHEESQQALTDLREVTWRVYPSALDREGLHAALEGVADRARVPVRLQYNLAMRPNLETATVLYFVASEAVTNALKHGEPRTITIVVEKQENEIVLGVHDDGMGGADIAGSGLSGLRSRVEAADGILEVFSPPGGPTLVVARLPGEPGIGFDLPAGWDIVPAGGEFGAGDPR